jgi:uncharacterized phage protein (TIGR01671 family)
MREIKFRAWDISNKYMHQDVQNGILAEKDGKMVLGLTLGTLAKDAGNHLMQYTGLKDKNGVDIYEGDILRTDNEDCDLRTIIDVRYCPSYHGLDCGDTDRFEVIGNIHQNPELCRK